jgi:hypothetical protein
VGGLSGLACSILGTNDMVEPGEILLEDNVVTKGTALNA